MRHDVALAIVAFGCAVVAASALGAAVVRGGIFVRLHFLTPVTSLGVPVVAVGLCVESGQPWVVAELLVIAVLLGIAGPVVETATARAAARRLGVLDGDTPQ